MKSVLYTHTFLKKKVINNPQEDFKKQAIIVANHTSFLDILAIGMLSPKIIFLVNDWVYNSPVFGKAVQLAGFYPVSSGIENGLNHLKKKLEQGYSLMVFPEGTRSKTNKIRRFHKGAFYLAEHFKIDIIPVLIHGNSEIIPKGESMIRDGSITLKILDRITPTDARFSSNYSQRTKQISAFFKSEFANFRKEREDATYFHKMILDEYRYKDNSLYKDIKKDLSINKHTYNTIIHTVGLKDTVAYISNNCGQLEFLMALDSPDRKIISYLKNKAYRVMVNNSYLTNTRGIKCVNSLEEINEYQIDTLIINDNSITLNDLKAMISKGVLHIILFSSCNPLLSTYVLNLNYKSTYKDQSITILTQ